jgi:hypothetical protein
MDSMTEYGPVYWRNGGTIGGGEAANFEVLQLREEHTNAEQSEPVVKQDWG